MAHIEAPRFKPGEVRSPKPKPVTLEARVGPPAYRSFNHVSGRVSSGRLNYDDVYSFAWWRGGDVEAPVRLELSEELGGLFSEVRVQADYLPSRTRAFGSELTLSPEGRPAATLYRARIRRLETRELVSVGGETMLTRLQNFEPETLRVKGPFTPKQALERMLKAWQGEAPWLRWARVSELFVETETGYVVPQIAALALEQPSDLSASKTSAYGWLERFFKLFSAYTFRVNHSGELSVVRPRLDPHKRLELGVGTPFKLLDSFGFSRHLFAWGARRVRLNLAISSDEAMRGRVEYDDVILEEDEESRFTNARYGYTIIIKLYDNALFISVSQPGGFFVRGHVEVLEASAQAPFKRLEAKDVGFGLREITDIEGVVNRCSVSSQGYEFVEVDELLEPAYALFGDSEIEDVYAEPEDRKKVTSVWSAPQETIIGSDTLQAAIYIEAYTSAGNVATFSLNVTLDVGRGERVFVERKRGLLDPRLELEFYLRFTGTQVQLYGVSRAGYEPNGEPRANAWIVLLNAAGEKFARSNEKVFGFHDESENSPFGIKRDDIDAGPFPISYEVAQAIAERRVARAKEPVTIAEFEQSPRLPVLPDDLGTVLELPDGRRGTVTSFAYAEAHTPQGSLSRSSVKVRLEKSEI